VIAFINHYFNPIYFIVVSIVDLQMLVGRDGQLYVMDPANSDSSSVEPPHYMHDSLQKFRTEGIRDLRKWRNTSINVLKAFNQNKGVHAIFVSKEMLERDPKFEKSLLDHPGFTMNES
jgi:hypothetical protein